MLQVIRSSSDFKTQIHGTGSDVCMNICGFQQLDPFLTDFYEMCSRRDGFMDRFHVACPNSKLLTLDDVEKHSEDLQKFPDKLKGLGELYRLVASVHTTGNLYRYAYDYSICQSAIACNFGKRTCWEFVSCGSMLKSFFEN